MRSTETGAGGERGEHNVRERKGKNWSGRMEGAAEEEDHYRVCLAVIAGGWGGVAAGVGGRRHEKYGSHGVWAWRALRAGTGGGGHADERGRGHMMKQCGRSH